MDSSGAASCANLQEKMREVAYKCKIPVERVDGEGRGTTCRTCRACRTIDVERTFRVRPLKKPSKLVEVLTCPEEVVAGQRFLRRSIALCRS